MMDLSLRGSQICLSKLSGASGRNSARSVEKPTTSKPKSMKDRPSKAGSSTGRQERKSTAGKIETESLKSVCSKENTPVVMTSQNALARSQRNVTDWLDAYVKNPAAAWEDIEVASVESASRKPSCGEPQRKEKCHPENKGFLDSLELPLEEQDNGRIVEIQHQTFHGRRTSNAQTVASDVSLGPPPTYSAWDSTENQTINLNKSTATRKIPTSRQTEAARTIQKFWRRYRRRQLAAQAALRRMMEEQKQRMKAISPDPPEKLTRKAMKRYIDSKSSNKLRDSLPNSLVKKRGAKSSSLTPSSNGTPESTILGSQNNNAASEYNYRRPELSESNHARNDRQAVKSPASISTSSEKEPPPLSDDETLSHRNSVKRDKSRTATPNTISEPEDPSKLIAKTILDELASEINSEDEPAEQGVNLLFLNELAEKDDQNNASKGWSEMLNEINRVLSETDVIPNTETFQFERRTYNKTPSVATEPIVPTQLSKHDAFTDKNRVQSAKSATSGDPSCLLNGGGESREQLIRKSIGQTFEKTVNDSRAFLATKCQADTGTSTGKQKRPLNSSHRLETKLERNGTRTASSNIVQANPWNTNSEVPEFRGSFQRCPSNSSTVKLNNTVLESSANTGTSLHTTWLSNTLGAEASGGLTMQSLAMQLEERTQSVQRLQRVLEHQRELSMRQLRDTQREAEQRTESLKADYEATLARNYKLIDELIEEKKALHAKCESLMTEMKTVTHRLEEKLKVVQDRHKVDLRKAEAKAVAAEKLRREKWETEKTKQLKELTARGLEAEIAQLISKHQQEMQELKQSCSEQIQSADTRAFQTYLQQLEELRRTLLREKEEACVREREAANQRLEKTLSDERTILEVHRNRILKEMSDERERLTLIATKERENAEQTKLSYEKTLSESTEKHQRELDGQRAQLTKQHEQMVEAMQKRHELELESLQEKLTAELEAKHSKRESELRGQLKQERDRQLETAVQHLEADMDKAKEELQREADSKIKRMKDKYLKELEELERSEQQAMAKYTEMRNQLLECEHELEKYKIQLKQKNEELEDVKAVNHKLNAERQNITEVVRQEFSDRIIASEEENRSLKRDFAELRSRLAIEQDRHLAELKAAKQASATELESVHQKIKEVIARKDKKLATLQTQFEAELKTRNEALEEANQRAVYLEELLDQQRQQFLQTSS